MNILHMIVQINFGSKGLVTGVAFFPYLEMYTFNMLNQAASSTVGLVTIDALDIFLPSVNNFLVMFQLFSIIKLAATFLTWEFFVIEVIIRQVLSQTCVTGILFRA